MASSVDLLDPDLASAARALDHVVRVSRLRGYFTSTLRTSAEQERLYRSYLAGTNPFPVVPQGASAHEYGLAFDYVVEPYSDDLQAQLGAIWKNWGGGWAVSDAVHFEVFGASEAAMNEYNRLHGGSVGASIRSWADWFNDLPWYVSALLPVSLSVSTDVITKADVNRVLKNFHIPYQF